MALILRSISWCSKGNAQYGSIYCRKNYDEPISPEWMVKPAPESMVGVFVPPRLEHIYLTVQVENTGDDAVNATLSVREIDGETRLLGNFEFPAAYFAAHKTTAVQTKNIDVSNLKKFWSTKRSHKQNRIWRWSYTTVFSEKPESMVDTLHTFYLLPWLPAASLWNVQQGSCDENSKNYIWTELLDACNEACEQYAASHGGQTPVTDKEYVSAFTAELNHNSVFHYDVWSGSCAYFSYIKESYNGAIKLKKYLWDRKQQVLHNLNCSDCAAIVSTEARAYGIEAYIGHMRNGNTTFRCNPIIAIGCSAWEPPFKTGRFSYHAVTVLNRECTEQTKIYDACLHLDSGESPCSLNPQRKKPLLPIDIPFSNDMESPVNVPTDAPFTANLYRERLVADKESCTLDSVPVSVTNLSPSLSLTEKRTAAPSMTSKENPLPAIDGDPVWKHLSAASFEKLGSWKQTEAYGRYQVYSLTRADGVCIQVSFWAALDHEEAWILLQTRMSEISCPLEKREFGDAAYGIGRNFLLFSYGNLIMELNGYGNDIQKTAEEFERCLHES